MPSQAILARKQQFVAELSGKIKSAQAGVLVEYKGITVAEDTKLRADLRKAGVDYSVIKNTLLKRALADAGYGEFEPLLKDTTALALSQNDPVAAAKVLAEFAKKSKKNYRIKAGFVDGRAISTKDTEALAELPPREQLIARVLGGFNAPISGLVNVLNGNIRGLAVALNAIAEKRQAEQA